MKALFLLQIGPREMYWNVCILIQKWCNMICREMVSFWCSSFYLNRLTQTVPVEVGSNFLSFSVFTWNWEKICYRSRYVWIIWVILIVLKEQQARNAVKCPYLRYSWYGYSLTICSHVSQQQSLHSKLCIGSSSTHSGTISTDISGRSAWVSTAAFGSHVKISKHFQYVVLSDTLLYVRSVKQMVSTAVFWIWQNMLASVVR